MLFNQSFIFQSKINMILESSAESSNQAPPAKKPHHSPKAGPSHDGKGMAPLLEALHEDTLNVEKYNVPVPGPNGKEIFVPTNPFVPPEGFYDVALSKTLLYGLRQAQHTFRDFSRNHYWAREKLHKAYEANRHRRPIMTEDQLNLFERECCQLSDMAKQAQNMVDRFWDQLTRDFTSSA